MDMPDVKSASRVMAILELASTHPQGLTLSEFCEKLGMPKSSTHELLSVLEHRNFLQLDHKKFRIGIKVFELGQTASRNLDILKAIRPHLKWLSAQSSMTTQFGILESNEVIYLSKIKNVAGISVESQVGSRLPAHATALGKVMLSVLPENVLLEHYSNYVFDKFTPNSCESMKELLARIDLIKENGYAEDCEEFTQGVFCLAVIVPEIRTDTIGAISISMPLNEWNKVEKEKVIENLRLAGNRILKDATSYYSQKSQVS
jgi:DNA-binding IclR family transcriptional regulator